MSRLKADTWWKRLLLVVLAPIWMPPVFAGLCLVIVVGIFVCQPIYILVRYIATGKWEEMLP